MDSGIRTVWIVKESLLKRDRRTTASGESEFWQVFGGRRFPQHVEILSTFADEAHKAWRNPKSERSQVYRHIANHSSFNVLCTGTMWPLGPKADAPGVLQHLGGDLNTAEGKWKDPLRRGFLRLLDPKEDNWDITAFRIMISPFFLRRTISSTWEGRWIIKRTIARPVPQIILPYPDDFTEMDALQKFKRRIGQKNRETLTQKMDRADKQRYYTWSTLYADLVDSGVDEKNDKEVEKFISEKLSQYSPTGRVRRMIAMIKAARKHKMRFLLVSDRLFLIRLAYEVFSLYEVF